MANWIWYPGDFELYHSLCQNFDREERGFFWPANWKPAQYHHSVKFIYEYNLTEETQIRITAVGRGYVNLKWESEPPFWMPKERLGEGIFYAEKKIPVTGVITCPAGRGAVEIVLCDVAGFPAVLVEGDVINSDKNWLVADAVTAPEADGGESEDAARPAQVKVGWSPMYTRPEQNPRVFEYTSEIVQPVISEINGGLLYDFGRELTAETVIRHPAAVSNLTLCYGESLAEALDVEMCYLKHSVKLGQTRNADFHGKTLIAGEPAEDIWGSQESLPAEELPGQYRTRLRAFRYIFVPEKQAAKQCEILADYKYVNFPTHSSFTCSDERLNRIWQVSDITFRLASGIFFLDGIKRDRYIWSGDAYQSYFLSRYVFFDEEIIKRTMVALRGGDPITQHINGIVDYSMYWMIAIADFYEMSGDREFLEMIWPKMVTMMRYLERQIDENGLLYGRPGDWVFVDWSDLDKEGPISAENFLLARTYRAMDTVAGVLGKTLSCDYKEKEKNLLSTIRKFFWDEEKGAFIDSYVSGRRKVSRHPNIFAVLFGYATPEETASILTNVLDNPEVTAITTPYFKFWELEALAKLGRLDQVMTAVKEYWGGMLDRGADTFWEEFDPNQSEEQQYGMYGDPYGKSLCHAWGASPIYLIGRFLCGLYPTAPGYETFQVDPVLDVLPEFTAVLPVKGGLVNITWQDGVLEVLADRDGGVLVVNGAEYLLRAGKKAQIQLD